MVFRAMDFPYVPGDKEGVDILSTGAVGLSPSIDWACSPQRGSHANTIRHDAGEGSADVLANRVVPHRPCRMLGTFDSHVSRLRNIAYDGHRESYERSRLPEGWPRQRRTSSRRLGHQAFLQNPYLVPARSGLTMRGIPRQTGRIHPLVWSRAASQDDDFIRNDFSARLAISARTVFIIVVSTALMLLLLTLLD